ncbi:MAG: purine-binding chemotaxis protein CheW [Acidobacteria bacterium]|nr:MAG: purine-binding chemotaxis protein CheW [Acidobacteriota bacterium]
MDPEAILAAIEHQRDSETEPQAEQERASYLGFYLGDEVYGLPLDQLREVAHVNHLRRVPGAPAGVAGLVNLRGEILCALDVRAILGLPAPTAPTEAPFIVALRGFADPLGLIVDEIADIYLVASSDIEATPATWPAERAACFIGTARVPAGLMGLLDLARVTQV